MVIPFLFFLFIPLLLLSFPHCMLVFCRPYQSCEIITSRQRLSTLPGISAATRRPSRIPILRWASSRTETTTREEVVCVITLPGAQASVSILGTVSRPPPSRLPRPPLHGSQNLLRKSQRKLHFQSQSSNVPDNQPRSQTKRSPVHRRGMM
jgi:hypothetical protein